MKILSIETSCDETAIALVEADGDQNSPTFKVLDHALYSQAGKHAEFGGVYPSLAKREHAKNLVPLLSTIFNESSTDEKINVDWDEIEKLLEREPELFDQLRNFVETHVKLFDSAQSKHFDSARGKPDIDMIAVTSGPGLEPALWVGINFAKALSKIWNIPMLPVNHMEGHITSFLINQKRGNSKLKILNSKNNRNDLNLKKQSGIEQQRLPEFISGPTPQSRKDSEINSERHYDNKVETIQFPSLAVLISGGHTEMVLIKKWGDYEIIGKTKDDAIGEAYDKVARLLDLPYPGGPHISKLATEARGPRFRKDDKDIKGYKDIKDDEKKKTDKKMDISFPRPMIGTNDFDFSFSGLKTAVLYKTKELEDLDEEMKQIIAREFEQAVVDVLNKKVRKAIQKFEVKNVITGGGVIANTYIRENLQKISDEEGVKIFFPSKDLSTDNAIMIGIAGYLKQFRMKPEVDIEIKAEGNLKL